MTDQAGNSHHAVSRKNGDDAPQNLGAREISMIDEAIGVLGEYGEIRLIIQKGRLRYLVTQRSFDALKWNPGGLA